MQVVVQPGFGWRVLERDGARVSLHGDDALVDGLMKAVRTDDAETVTQWLRDVDGHFAAIVEDGGKIFACTDVCRSVPVFYVAGKTISNLAEPARAAAGVSAVDTDTVTEIAMSGFATGNRTAYTDLKQLQAGEYLRADVSTGETETRRYYRFVPDTLKSASQEDFATALAPVIDGVFRRLVDAAKGRRIWVPLSGGLDSRLILCKLVEMGHADVQAFSYGPAGNEEADVAKTVAARLGVPWRFVPSRKGDMKRYFASEKRKAFWDFAAGHCGTPNFQDLLPLAQLMEQGIVKPGDIVVNGQSGDFTTGGHIPPMLLSDGATEDTLFDAIQNKHFSLWASLKTPENLAMVRARVLSPFRDMLDAPVTAQSLAAVYEASEHDERQCKFVVNGQRVYDFLGLDWFLPLWDQKFVEFWRNIPAEQKVGQAIYKRYLMAYDYKGLFTSYTPCMDGWPGLSKLVLPFARIIRLTFGEAARDKYLKAMAVFGMYGYFLAPYGLFTVIRESQNFRNAISLFTRTWLKESGLPLPRGL